MVDPIEAPSPARVIRAGRARCRIQPGVARVGTSPVIPVIYPPGHDDQLLIVEATTNKYQGKRLAEVRGASIDKPSWVHNGVGSMGFACSAWNDAMDHLVTPGSIIDGAGVMRLVGRELQLWRDGVLHWQGPPVTGRPRLDGTVEFGCMDLGWHIARKFFGAAERRDLLLGRGSMDTPGLPGWAVVGSAWKARDTVDKQRGSGSMVLAGNGAVQIQFTQPARTPSPAIHLTAVVKIPTGTPVGTRVATVTVATLGGTVVDEGSIVTDDSTVLGEWQRAHVYARQPNGEAHRITVTLWSPGTDGATKFDDVRALENNTTGLTPGIDQADLVDHINVGLSHIQTGRGQGDGFGIGFRALSPTGVVEVLGERHLNHLQFTDFLRRYTERADGLDWTIDIRTRELVVGPRIGHDHTDIALHSRNVRSGGWNHDETGIAAKAVVPGDGDGVDRPEGGYTDASRTGGITYDDFYQPPADTPLSALDPTAYQRWDQVSQPQITLDELGISDEYLGTVGPGDTITGTLSIGKFRLPYDTPIRLSQVVLDREAGQLVLT